MAEWNSVADFVFIASQTLRKRQTLGEEYCSIVPCTADGKEFPGFKVRMLYCIGSVVGPYVLTKLLKLGEKKITDYAQNLFESQEAEKQEN